MRDKIKKIVQMSIAEKWIAVLAVMALAALLLPLIRLSFYAIPWYDDYGYGRFVKDMVATEGIFKGAWDGAIYTARTWWYCWQGTFSSIFMMALVPCAFGEQYYFIGIIGILLFFVSACMIFVKTLMANVLKAGRAVQVTAMILVTVTLLELIYTAQQGIFWYNSAIHYTFMHGCLFLLLAAAVKCLYAKSRAGVAILAVVAAGLALVCGGSNFVTALQGILALLLVIALGMLAKNKKSLSLLPAVCVYAVALYFNLGAPGNHVRGAYYTGFGAIKSILYSFKSAALHFWEFTGMITIIMLVLFILIIWNSIKKSDCKFAWPGVVTALSFGFYATGFTPSYYGMGAEGLARTLVVVKFTLQILLFINVTYWIGWWMNRRKKKGKEVAEARQWVLAYVVIIIGILSCFALSKNQAGEYASYGAYYYVHSGEAANFYGEYEERITEIKNGGDVVVVKPYNWKPWFLYKGDLSQDPTDERNKAMAEWYGKTAIVTE